METATITPTQPSQAILDYLESVKSKMTSFQSDVEHDLNAINARSTHTFIHAWDDTHTLIQALYVKEKDGCLLSERPYLFGHASLINQMYQCIGLFNAYPDMHYAILSPDNVRACTAQEAIAVVEHHLHLD